jgi:hypothetical protein
LAQGNRRKSCSLNDVHHDYSCQFHQRFKRAFFVQNFGAKNYKAVQSTFVQNFGTKNTLSYKKRPHKMLMKLNTGCPISSPIVEGTNSSKET